MFAGVYKQILDVNIGHNLIGYGNRLAPANGIHDPIHVRALALQQDETILIFCSIEICYLRPLDIRAIQTYVSEHSTLQAHHLLITTTHTHSAPGPQDETAWIEPFVEMVGDTIIRAYEKRQPAKIGLGAGFLTGYTINRRWLDRPIDPSVSVMRVETMNGDIMAIFSNFACHAVVLGYDNLLISGDWSGYSSRLLEDRFGQDCVAIFTQGGAGDINPLTETVRQRLNAGQPVTTIGELTSYYQRTPLDETWNIEDRAGGTFIECETLARAFNTEITRIMDRIEPQTTIPFWVQHVTVDATLSEDEPPQEILPHTLQRILPNASEEDIQMRLLLINLDNVIISTQPGEVFSETSVHFRKFVQQRGYRHAMLISYANGSYGYLPPKNAFAEGGYEVRWALGLGISRHLQNRIHAKFSDLLEEIAKRRK